MPIIERIFYKKSKKDYEFWIFYIVSLTLRNISVFPRNAKNLHKGKKTHGCITLFIVASLFTIIQYTLNEYQTRKNVSDIVSFNTAITGKDTIVSVYCGASIYCKMFQDENCEPERTLSNGDIAILSSDDCFWTLIAITEPEFETIKGASLALYLDSPEVIGDKILQPLIYTSSHNTEMYIHMTKTIDDHGTSIEHETWYVVPLIPLDIFSPCEIYQKNSPYPNTICIGLKIFINTNTYKVYFDSDAAFLYSMSMLVVLIITLMVSLKFFMIMWELFSRIEQDCKRKQKKQAKD